MHITNQLSVYWCSQADCNRKVAKTVGGKADMLRKPPGVHKVSPGEGREAMVKRWFPAFFRTDPAAYFSLNATLVK